MKKRKIKLHVFFLLLVGISGGILMIETYSEEQRLNKLGTSFTELYDDRLQAEEWVFRMNDLVHDKKSLLFSPSTEPHNKAQSLLLSEKLLAVHNAYAATKLSPAEKALNLELEKNLATMKELETKGLFEKQLLNNYEQMLTLLERMSLIQIEEGIKLKNTGEQTMATSRLGVKLHGALILVMMLSLLMLVKNTGLGNRVVQQHQLN